MIAVQKKSSKEKGYLEIDNSVDKIRVKNDNNDTIAEYCSIAELYREWEDYEDPKGTALGLMILTLTNFIENEPDEDKVDLRDCEQMLDKLKAWERLKDEGFRFKAWYGGSRDIDYEITSLGDRSYIPRRICDDLDLLFGGEE